MIKPELQTMQERYETLPDRGYSFKEGTPLTLGKRWIRFHLSPEAFGTETNGKVIVEEIQSRVVYRVATAEEAKRAKKPDMLGPALGVWNQLLDPEYKTIEMVFVTQPNFDFESRYFTREDDQPGFRQLPKLKDEPEATTASPKVNWSCLWCKIEGKGEVLSVPDGWISLRLDAPLRRLKIDSDVLRSNWAAQVSVLDSVTGKPKPWGRDQTVVTSDQALVLEQHANSQVLCSVGCRDNFSAAAWELLDNEAVVLFDNKRLKAIDDVRVVAEQQRLERRKLEGDVMFREQRPSTAVLHLAGEDGEMLVRVHPDGSVEFGKNYSEEKAARSFWECVGQYIKEDHAPGADWSAEEVASFEHWRANEAEAKLKDQPALDRRVLKEMFGIGSSYGFNATGTPNTEKGWDEVIEEAYQDAGVPLPVKQIGHVKLTQAQAEHWETVQWLIEPTARWKAHGRTTLLALAFITWADEHFGQSIDLWDHYRNGPEVTRSAVQHMLTQFAEEPAWKDKRFELTKTTLKRIA